ncbi:hypothetical protein, partial [Ohtaekwangia sp.]|uniref:hypothetical protein n=1 Tax=Ohtaekwangia sp. TaxID=2066019 RepID=UPI002FDCE133
YYLVVLFLHITGNTLLAYILLALCLAASNFTIFSIYISPESLSCSTLIFFVYHYYKFLQTSSYRNLLFAGLFLGWLVTLKAYFAILFLPIGIHFLFTQNRFNLNHLIIAAKRTLVIATPLIIFLTPWTIRNYTIYGKIIPLQINATAGYNYTQADMAFRRFVQAWGGDIIFWEKTSAGCYFIPNAGIPCEFKMPAYAYTREYDSTDIQSVRSKYINLQTHYSETLEKEVTADFDRLTKSFQQEKPWQFYIVSPFRITAKFLVHSGSYYLPIHSSNPCFHPIQLGIKVSQTVLYWISLLAGLPGIILLSIRTRNSVLAFIPLSLILLFPFIFHVGEARYFRTAEPLLYLGALYLVWSLFSFLKDSQHPTIA